MRILPLLLLAAVLGVPSADAGAPPYAGQTDAAFVRGAVPDRLAAPIHGLPVYERRAAAAEHATLTAGDLDGDGGDDLVVLATTYEGQAGAEVAVMRLRARSGRTGALLWSYDHRTAEVTPLIFGRIGADRRPGVILTSYAGAALAGVDSGALVTTLTALRGDGTVAWTRALTGVVTSGAAVDVAYVQNGYVDRGHTSVLVAVVDAVPGVLDVTPTLVDGRDGAARTAAAPLRFEQTLHLGMYGVGDVDRDGAGDYVVAATRSASDGAANAEIVVRSGAVDRTLWRRAVRVNVIVVGREHAGVPDVSGDGVPDVDVSGVDVHSAGGTEEAVSTLVDGRTGATVATARGPLIVLGDTDGRAGAEYAVASHTVSGRTSGVRLDGYTRGGRRLWSAVRTRASSVPGFSFAAGESAGDVQGDRVADWRYTINTDSTESGWVDGRTGRLRRDPPTRVIRLLAAIDGRGYDMVVPTATRDVVTISARAGDSGRELWRTSVRATRYPNSLVYAAGVRLNGDRCGDVLARFTTQDKSVLVAIDGASGRPLWRLDDDKVSKPAALGVVDRNGCR